MQISYDRKLEQLKKVKKNWLKVFSTFSCGGWSSMWYKMAWYEVIANCDIDPEMMKVYRQNFAPQYSYLEWIQRFAKRDQEELPEELKDIDILDWSPPCSTFSMSWSREKVRGQKKKFREWQADQVLDDLFFDFLHVVGNIRPKVMIAENVKWMLIWKAKGYTKMIMEQLRAMDYHVQIFLLNGAALWLPQRRERLFFVAYDKKRYTLPKLTLDIKLPPVTFEQIDEWNVTRERISDGDQKLWNRCLQGRSLSTVHPKGNRFNSFKIGKNQVPPTLPASRWAWMYHHTYPGRLTQNEICSIWSWPKDYDFMNIEPQYLIGMSVPPLMMYHVANAVKEQWFDKM